MGRRTPADIDALLGRDDYFEYWLANARMHAARYGWRANVDALLTVLASIIGKDWLLAEARRPDRRPPPAASSKHPLGRLFASPSPAGVAKVLELAIYLKRCTSIPRFDEVVVQLRAGPQFDRAFVPLALAYRLARLGCTAVEFEPPADGNRKADLVFTDGAIDYVLECYKPDVPHRPEYEELVVKSSDKFRDRCARLSKRAVIHVVVAESHALDLESRRAIERDVGLLVERVGARGRESVTGPGYEIEVFDTAGVEEEQINGLVWSLATWGTSIIMHRLVPSSQLRGIHRTGDVRGPTRSWVVITPKDAARATNEAIAQLAERAEQKIPQLRRGTAKGVLVLDSAVAGPAVAGDPSARGAVGRLREEVLGAHPGIAGAWILHRTADERMRPNLGAIFVAAEMGTPFHTLSQRMGEREAFGNVLDDPD